MNLKVVRIADRGVPGKERLHLSVEADADLVYYVVFATEYQGLNISQIVKHVLWFKSYKVKAGDNVVLATGSGANSTSRRADGGTDHFFYWGQPQVLFAAPLACAVVVEIQNWATTSPGQ